MGRIEVWERRRGGKMENRTSESGERTESGDGRRRRSTLDIHSMYSSNMGNACTAIEHE